jgi:hypothetical protein
VQLGGSAAALFLARAGATVDLFERVAQESPVTLRAIGRG